MPRPTRDEIFHALTALKGLVLNFPEDAVSMSLIADSVLSFVEDTEKLHWWVQEAARLSKWQGLEYLRAVYCTRFRPADGVWANVTIPGYSSVELEGQYMEREMKENGERMDRYRKEFQSLPEAERKMLGAPVWPAETVLKPMPVPEKEPMETCFWCRVESPKATFEAFGACPKCQTARPTLAQREEALEKTKTAPRTPAERLRLERELLDQLEIPKRLN